MALGQTKLWANIRAKEGQDINIDYEWMLHQFHSQFIAHRCIVLYA
jgi:hypothetical protein